MEIVLKPLVWGLRQHLALGWLILCFILFMCMPVFHNTAHNRAEHISCLKLLRKDRPAERYRWLMRRWLDGFDTRLSTDAAQQGPARRA